MKFIFLLFILWLNLLGTGCESSQNSNSLTAEDKRQVLSNMKNYRDAWLRNDSTTIMNFVSPDLILYMPNSQGKSKVGKDSIRAFWFPPSNITYPITAYEVAKEQLEGDRQFCIYSGVSKLSWYVLNGSMRSSPTTVFSEFVNVLRKENGQWKLFRVMYNVKDSAYFAR